MQKGVIPVIQGGLLACLVMAGIFLIMARAHAGGERGGNLTQNGITTPKVPAPRLTEVTTENIAPHSKPLITGAVDASIQRVRVVVDNILKDEITVKNGEIHYQSAWPLKLGEHFVYAVSINNMNKESVISNVINFFITIPEDVHEPKISAITIEGDEDKSDQVATATDFKLPAPLAIATTTVSLRDIVTTDLLLFMIVIGILVAWIFVQIRRG